MVRNNEGLTKTYNRFHDPHETSPDILKLRELHAAMDRAVLEAYGWHDLAQTATCEFLLDYEDDEDEEEPSPQPLAQRAREEEALALPRRLELAIPSPATSGGAFGGGDDWANLFDDLWENPPGYFLGSMICINRSDDLCRFRNWRSWTGSNAYRHCPSCTPPSTPASQCEAETRTRSTSCSTCAIALMFKGPKNTAAGAVLSGAQL